MQDNKNTTPALSASNRKMTLKDIDGLIKSFVQKAVQIVVQSRLGGELVHTLCKPNKQDLFNLEISDFTEIQENTNRCFQSMFAMFDEPTPYLKQDWNVCCEISMKNVDGDSLVLEYWIISNRGNIEDKGKPPQYIFQSYHRLADMLKSLLITTRATPAYRLSSKGQSGDSYVICYRVYPIDQAFLKTFADSSRKEHRGQFSAIKTLGTVKNYCNELTTQLVYRENLNTVNNEDSAEKERLGMMNEKEDACAVQDILLPLKEDHFKEDDDKEFVFRLGVPDLFEPIKPAFVDNEEDDLIEAAKADLPFSNLLSPKEEEQPQKSKELLDAQPKGVSKPIAIPANVSNSKAPIAKSPQQQIYSTSNESFVFVDLNCPFVCEDKVDFFNAPSPTFIMNNSDETGSVSGVAIDRSEELNQVMAELVSQVPEVDSFVGSICIEEEDADVENEDQ